MDLHDIHYINIVLKSTESQFTEEKVDRSIDQYKDRYKDRKTNRRIDGWMVAYIHINEGKPGMKNLQRKYTIAMPYSLACGHPA